MPACAALRTSREMGSVSTSDRQRARALASAAGDAVATTGACEAAPIDPGTGRAYEARSLHPVGGYRQEDPSAGCRQLRDDRVVPHLGAADQELRVLRVEHRGV